MLLTLKRGPRPGGLTPDQDYVNRASGSGITMATNFNTSAEVTNWIHPVVPDQENVSWDTTNKLTGSGALRIDTPASYGTNQGEWRRPLNNAWTLTTQGWGNQEWYLQVICRYPANRMQATNGGGGFKNYNISGYDFVSPENSRSHSDHEIVCATRDYRFPIVYRQTSGGGTDGLYEAFGGGGNVSFQPALDNGVGLDDEHRFCLLDPSSIGCYGYPVDRWFELYQRTKILTYGGSAGNELDLDIAIAGGPRIPLYRARNFDIGSDTTYTGGHSTLWLLNYDTNRINASYSTFFLVDQVLAGTSPIAQALLA